MNDYPFGAEAGPSRLNPIGPKKKKKKGGGSVREEAAKRGIDLPRVGDPPRKKKARIERIQVPRR